MADMVKLTRKFIEDNTSQYLRTAGGTRPDVRLVEFDGRKVVVKDFKNSDFLFRMIVGPILIRREFGAMRNLLGVANVPQVICRLDRYALVMDYVPSTSLADLQPGVLDDEFYIRLRQAVDEMHSRGVAHCDLRSRGNVVRGEDGKPYIVDFAACVFHGRGFNPFTRWLFSQFVIADRNAVVRIKQRLSPELLTDEDRAELAVPLPFERPAKFIGQNTRKLTRRLLTRGKE